MSCLQLTLMCFTSFPAEFILRPKAEGSEQATRRDNDALLGATYAQMCCIS